MTTVLAGKYPKNIIPDSWLSTAIGRDAFCVSLDGNFAGYPGIVNVFKLHQKAFFYAKVSVDDAQGIAFLEEQGFRLIDTNIVLEKPVENKSQAVEDVAVRLAKPEDKDNVRALAGSCFRYSRFHLDPAFTPALANKIKAEWAGNYFDGKRGQNMIVAQKGNDIVGFLQLLDDKAGTITIDLIGVAEHAQKQGIAGAMIAFAQKQSSGAKKIIVGTQIANVPSVRCYEKIGFKFTKAAYVFHYHG